MKAKALNTIIKDFEVPEVLAINYDLYKLIILFSANEKDEYHIIFDEPIAFRCLNERDMIHYWEPGPISETCIVEILEGGFLDIEKPKDAFWTEKNAREFLIKGIDDCVSVISHREPNILKLEK